MNIAIIPARKNSQRIINKNIKIFNDKPIIYWSIKVAKMSKLFKEILFRPIQKIAQIAIRYGAKVLYPRPSNLSNNYATIIDVIKFEIKNLENKKVKFNNVCCIFPAAPLLKVKYLSDSLSILNKMKSKGFVFAANELSKSSLRSFYFKKLDLVNYNFTNTRTQDLPKTYIDAGQFYWGAKNEKKQNSVFIKSSKY